MPLGRGGRAGVQQADGVRLQTRRREGRRQPVPQSRTRARLWPPPLPSSGLRGTVSISWKPGRKCWTGGDRGGRGQACCSHTPRGPRSLSALVRCGLGPPNSAVTATVPRATPSGSPCRLKMKPAPATNSPQPLSSRQLPRQARALSFRPVPEPTCSASLFIPSSENSQNQ